MSKLSTTIPIDVKSVIDALPKGSFVHWVMLNEAKTGVEIVWDNDDIKTGFTFPTEYPLEKLGFNDKVLLDKVPKRSKKSTQE